MKLSAVAAALAAAFALPACKKKEEARPAETKPAETRPAETRPAETKPAETKPAETNEPATPAPPPAAAVPTAKMPAECAKLKATIDRIATCDKVDAATKKAFADSWTMMAKSLADWDKMGADDQETVKRSCATAGETVEMLSQDC